jgi:hypothetical protein
MLHCKPLRPVEVLKFIYTFCSCIHCILVTGKQQLAHSYETIDFNGLHMQVYWKYPVDVWEKSRRETGKREGSTDVKLIWLWWTVLCNSVYVLHKDQDCLYRLLYFSVDLISSYCMFTQSATWFDGNKLVGITQVFRLYATASDVMLHWVAPASRGKMILSVWINR